MSDSYKVEGFIVTVRNKDTANKERKYIELPKSVRKFVEIGKHYKCSLEEV
jgi:hypothetical protein